MRVSNTTGAAHGFTLTELAIVLVIVALLIGGMLIPLSAQRDVQAANDTQRQLAEIRDALLGFAAANGRLPCPASPNLTGVENPAGGGACTNQWNGFLPGITLGIGPTDAQGYVLDAWSNRIRYAVTTSNSNAFTTTNGVKNNWSGTLSPDLKACNTAANITNGGTSSANCPSADRLTDTAVAVLISPGRNGGTTPTSADELANWPSSNDPVFVNATQSPAFDDIVLWLSANILYNRLIAAGKLP
ncbi:MAG: type II secretion system protein [Propionivibrio sp.]